MSAKNKSANKKLRREIRAASKELNEVTYNAQASAKYGTCAVTGKKTIVDHEYSISQPAWFAIMDYTVKLDKENRCV